MCFHVCSCQTPLKDASEMLCVVYVVSVMALSVLTSETKSVVDIYTYILSRNAAYYCPAKKCPQ